MGDQCDVGAQRRDRQVARVDASDEHLPAGRVVEAREEIEQRRLAGSRRSADGDDLARFDDEVEVVQHVHLAAVREAHVLEADVERALLRKASWTRRLGQRLDPVEPAEAATGRGERPLCQVENPADGLERPDELEEQRLEQHELADRDLPVDDGAAAEEHDGGDRECGEVVEARHVRRLDAGLVERGGADSFGPFAEALAHLVLAAERLHHLDPDDGLVGGLGHVPLPRLHPARDGRDATSEAVGDEPDRRQRHRRVERQLWVDEGEDDPGRDDHHHALRPLHEPPADEVADGIQVVRRPREHLPGRVAVVEGARVAEVRLVEELPHPRLDPDPDPGGRIPAVEVDDEAQQGEPADRREIGRELVLLVRDDRVVDRPLDEDRDDDRDQRVGERAREPEEAELPLLTPQPEQPAERGQQAEVGWFD